MRAVSPNSFTYRGVALGAHVHAEGGRSGAATGVPAGSNLDKGARAVSIPSCLRGLLGIEHAPPPLLGGRAAGADRKIDLRVAWGQQLWPSRIVAARMLRYRAAGSPQLPSKRGRASLAHAR